MLNKSKRYTDEFKRQIITLVNNGKPAMEIAKEYDIARSTVSKWVSDYNNSRLFKAKNNKTEEEKELEKLKKENQRLKI